MYVSLTTICQISPLCHLVLQYSRDCMSATTAQMLEQTENVAYSTIISLTMKRQGKPKFYSYSDPASSSLAVMLAMVTKVTQISLMVSVALGKHQIAQQLLGHHSSVRSEKQTAMAENLFDWC